MRTGSILFLLGITLLIRSPHIPPHELTLLLPVAVILIFKSPRWSWPAWILCGFLWALFRADIILTENLGKRLEGIPLQVQGRVVSLPVNRDTLIRFDFQVERMIDSSGREYPAPDRIRLSWYRPYPALEPGEYWHLAVKLKRPYGFMNPGGFDYEGYLFRQRIGATGYVLKRADNVMLAAAYPLYIHHIRFLIRKKLKRLLAGQPLAPLATALVIGDRSAISPAQWRVLNRTGTNHLLAISGLHIGLIGTLIFFLCRRLWPLTGGLARLIAGPRAASLAAIGGAAIYAALAGFSVPTQRALIMLAVVLLLTFFNRLARGSNVICLALLLILIIDPFSIMSTGFWLSFAAVAFLMYGMTNRTVINSFWWRWGRVQWLVAVGLIPLLVLSYQQLPLLGMVANFIAVPWVSMLSVPLILCGVAVSCLHEGAGSLILSAGLESLKLIWNFLGLLSHFDPGVLQVPAPGMMALASAVIGAILLLMPRGMPGRWLGTVWLLPLLYPGYNFPAGVQFRFILLDVGQGLAAAVRTRHHFLLFDTGPRYSDRFDAGTDVILPYLQTGGLRRIDYLVVSHGDNDHMGGLPQLLQNVEIGKVISSVPGRIKNFHATACQAGDRWRWDGVDFAILHPQPGSSLRGNDRSCVLQVRSGKHSLLLTGDIELRAELELVIRYGDALKSEVLVAPHHGSDTSSSLPFIDAVHPRYVLFPVGYRNRFGFPKQDIIARYRTMGAVPLDTAASGAIEMVFSRQGINVIQYRQRLHHFWNSWY